MPSKSLFPQFCGSSIIKSHWSSKSNSLGFSVPLLDPQVEETFVGLRILQQCKNFFGIIVLQFVSHLLSSPMVGLMATSSKRVYAIPRSAAPRAPAPCGRPLLTCTFAGDTQTQFWLSLWGLWDLVYTRFFWALWASLPIRGLILNAISPLLPSYWCYSFAPGCGVSFLVGSNILLLTVVQQWVVILEFLQEKMSTHPSTLPSSSIYLLPETFWLILIF